jgi:hypothetical protein
MELQDIVINVNYDSVNYDRGPGKFEISRELIGGEL